MTEDCFSLVACVQSKDTGQLAVTVYIANAAGCMARIFTSVQEGGGYAMVRGFLLGGTLWKSTPKQLTASFCLCSSKSLQHGRAPLSNCKRVTSDPNLPRIAIPMQVWCSMESLCTSALPTAAREQGKRDSERRERRRSEHDLPRAHLPLEQYPSQGFHSGARPASANMQPL